MMRPFFKACIATVGLVVGSAWLATPAEAGGSFGFGFSYHSGYPRYYYRDYYCGPRYYPRTYITYSYVYTPPVVCYTPPPPVYCPPPVYYAPPPPPAPRYYFYGGTFQSY